MILSIEYRIQVENTYIAGICCRRVLPLSAPASIKKTECPLLARFALYSVRVAYLVDQ